MMRCVVCGGERADERPWCSKRCRSILREEARARFPNLDDGAALRAALAWAAGVRDTRPSGPLTDRIAARLAAIPKRTTGEAIAARQSVAAERFEVPTRGHRGK